jgi:hypothetical protein
VEALRKKLCEERASLVIELGGNFLFGLPGKFVPPLNQFVHIVFAVNRSCMLMFQPVSEIAPRPDDLGGPVQACVRYAPWIAIITQKVTHIVLTPSRHIPVRKAAR